MLKKDNYGFGLVGVLIFIIVFGLIGLVGWRVLGAKFHKNNPSSIIKSGDSLDQKAYKAGKNLSEKCSGTEKLTFTHLPMRPQDFNNLIPYGALAGGHVTPIDHMYFGPADYKSARDVYPVYAMADATITDIQPRTNERGTEYRFVFMHSCTSFYYYDLVTSLTGKVKEAYEKHNFNLPVKAGDQVGAIGGQTLDFAYWDTDKPLTGFVNPASYDGESWKIYTADPYPRFAPEIKTLLIARNARTAEPIAGKIDYDIDGKLIGNWFIKDSGGYSGDKKSHASNYYKTHLSIAPDLYDPSHFAISIGDFNGQPLQFAAENNSPDPATVSVKTGLVKYNLVKYGHNKPDGNMWDNMSLTKNPTVQNQSRVEGCLIVQLLEDRLLKSESFVSKDCSIVSGFDNYSKLYTR